ncbi:MAG: glycosyltransferase involved in cell wall biosynthesis [Cryomorphaceae bacterium]
MKVAFDNQIFSWQSFGGVSRYFSTLARELSAEQQDVKIYAGFHCNQYLSSLPQGLVSGVRLNRYPAHTNKFFRLLNNITSTYQVNRWQPDIVHETYYAPGQLVKNSARIVSTVHDMNYELYPAMFSKKDLTSLRKRNALHRADQIISVSHNTKSDLIELFGIDDDKVTVVHHGVDFDFFHTLSSLKMSRERPYLLYVGRREAYKNFSKALQALASSHRLKSDFDLVAFGGGKFNLEEQSLISSLGFSEAQISQVDGDDKMLGSLYHQAKAFLYPSIYEGFGMPPLEAMASSCPVISSDTSSMPEVIGRAGQFFDPTDLDSFIQAIEDVVYSDSRTHELRSLGLERAESFSWSVCASKTIKVYNKALDRSNFE